jgi:hypothetical protein
MSPLPGFDIRTTQNGPNPFPCICRRVGGGCGANYWWSILIIFHAVLCFTCVGRKFSDRNLLMTRAFAIFSHPYAHDPLCCPRFVNSHRDTAPRGDWGLLCRLFVLLVPPPPPPLMELRRMGIDYVNRLYNRRWCMDLSVGRYYVCLSLVWI